MTISTGLFLLFLIIGGAAWAFLMRYLRGDPGKSYAEVRKEKREKAQTHEE